MNPTSHRPKIAVIGAGWAGLSAALHLLPHCSLTVFEAGKQAGGRARTAGGSNTGFSFLDNGQHLLLGAYRGVLSLMKQIGVSEQEAFIRLPMQWNMHHDFSFQTASLPAPWHTVAGILLAQNIGLEGKTKLLRDMVALQQHHRKQRPDTNIASWLHKRHTPSQLIEAFWQPLVLGALNTPLETASLNTLCHVLHDGVWTQRSGSDWLLPKQDLGSIFAEPALHYLTQGGASIHLSERVPRLLISDNGSIHIAEGIFDAVILATAPYHVAALLPEHAPPYLADAYHNITYHAITTVYLRYPHPIQLPSTLYGLSNGTAHWLLDRGKLGLPSEEIIAIISVSDSSHLQSSEEWAAAVHTDIKRILPDVADPISYRVITEKRATPASPVCRSLPDLSWLHQNRIYPAGDYLHPRYPATLEAAVQSGACAAQLCLNNLHKCNT